MNSLLELQDIIHRKYGVSLADLDPHASLREHGVDSLTLVEFLFAVEDHYRIEIPKKYSDVDTLVALAAVVDEIRAAQTV